jgi:hypothetical protein
VGGGAVQLVAWRSPPSTILWAWMLNAASMPLRRAGGTTSAPAAAAADGADVAGRPSLYELAGLDREGWLVTALDIEVVNGRLGAVGYADDRITGSGQQVSSDVETVIAEHGHLPVTAVLFPRAADSDLPRSSVPAGRPATCRSELQ